MTNRGLRPVFCIPRQLQIGPKQPAPVANMLIEELAITLPAEIPVGFQFSLA